MKSKLLPFILLASIILISGCISSSTGGASGNEKSKVIGLKWETMKQFQDSLIRVGTCKDSTICLSSNCNVTDLMMRGIHPSECSQPNCFFNCAIVKEDVAFCNKIVVESGQAENCYHYLATLKRDPSVCDQVPDLIKMCRNEAIAHNLDTKYCDMMSMEKIKSNCKRDANQ